MRQNSQMPNTEMSSYEQQDITPHPISLSTLTTGKRVAECLSVATLAVSISKVSETLGWAESGWSSLCMCVCVHNFFFTISEYDSQAKG